MTDAPAELPITMRAMRAEDIPFITDSWLHSYREANYGVPHDQYFNTQRQVIKRLFNRSRVVVACDKDDADHVFGYAVWEAGDRPILHWSFTKHTFRRFGIFRKLLKVVDPEGKGMLASHRSIHMKELQRAGINIKYAHFTLTSSLVEEPK